MSKQAKQPKIIELTSGEHVAIFGQNGSGKSIAGMNAIHYADFFPVVIYDTKLDDDFYTVIPENFTDVTVYNYDTFVQLLKMEREKLPDYIIVRPNEEELDNPKRLDAYLLEHYKRLPDSIAYIDEAYHFHGSSGICFTGMKALLTRGRSLGITCVICSQRPFFISTFIKSEVKHFYCYRITTKKDKNELVDICKYLEQDSSQILEPYHFWYYDVVKNVGEIRKPIVDVRNFGKED